MGQTIQAFVDKIRTEGIQAGQKEADDLLARANQQAQQIIAQAEKDRDRILAGAQAEADSTLTRGRTELELAARDAAGKLRDALSRAIRAAMAAGVKAKLEDEAFVGQALHEIITEYSKGELQGKGTFRINVPEQMRQKLVDWALAHIGQDTPGPEHITIDLKGTLAQAGFEYNATGATVEVTTDSVVEVLASLVGPALRDILDKAAAEDKS